MNRLKLHENSNNQIRTNLLRILKALYENHTHPADFVRHERAAQTSVVVVVPFACSILTPGRAQDAQPDVGAGQRGARHASRHRVPARQGDARATLAGPWRSHRSLSVCRSGAQELLKKIQGSDPTGVGSG